MAYICILTVFEINPGIFKIEHTSVLKLVKVRKICLFRSIFLMNYLWRNLKKRAFAAPSANLIFFLNKSSFSSNYSQWNDFTYRSGCSCDRWRFKKSKQENLNHFIILLRVGGGTWGCEKIWEGVLYFCGLLHFYDPIAFLWSNCSKSFEGVHEVAPSSPPGPPPGPPSPVCIYDHVKLNCCS
jgi:hypothetical protein